MGTEGVQGFTAGQLLDGKYRIERLIGRGGMGAVYRAVQEPLGRAVAVKTLRAWSNDSAERVQREKRFFQEAAVTASLTHPNTVVIYDYGELSDGGVYLVMEYLEGRSLRELIREHGKLDIDMAMRIASQIASSLAEAHDAGVVHRDVKPDNVMVVSRGGDDHFVKVVDFGLVKSFAANAEELTRENEFVGSLTYAAPERFLSNATTSPAGDMYSLGVVMYEMLAGRPPFLRDPDNVAQVMLQHLQTPPPRLNAMRTDVSPSLARIVHKCLAKDPADRFESMHALVEALAGSNDIPAGGPTTEVTVRDHVPVDDAQTMLWNAADSGVRMLLLESSDEGYELIHRTPSGTERQRALDEAVVTRLDERWRALGRASSDADQRLMMLERVTPQGLERLQVRYQRVQTLTGVRITMELLSEQQTQRSLGSIMPASEAARLAAWCESPHGVILIAGRPGSGKSTTSYACLDHAAEQGRIVFALEETVGFVLLGTHQMEVDLGDRDAIRNAFQAAIQQSAEVIFFGSSFGPTQDTEIFHRACAAARMGKLVVVEVDASSASDAVDRVSAVVDSIDDVLIGATWQELTRVDGMLDARYDLIDGALGSVG